MQSSLKGYTPALARLLGTTPAALYERQRALVRAGLLDVGDGRGPGSGVRSTPASVAMLLIGVLAADGLAGAESRAATIAGAKPDGGECCPLTRRRTFAEALSYLLAATGAAACVNEITISRTADRATIKFDNHDGAGISQFLGENSREPGIRVTATLTHSLLMSIVGDVQAIVGESFPDAAEGGQ
jgi:hypothetical protein